MKYTKRVLSNGLTVVEVPSSDAESVVVDFFVKTGSRSETDSESGISHFLEHFLFKGTKKYPSALAITELVDGIGGEMNANTGKEHTQYYIKAHSKHLPLVFEILTDMIQAPLLDVEEMEREKGVIIEELNMYKDAPMYEVDNLLERTMWPGLTLGRDIVGTRDTVTNFTQEMFQSYLTRHYQMPNMILGVAGKFNKKQLDALIKKYWEPVKKQKFHNWEKIVDNQNAPRVAVEFKQTEQAHVTFGFKGFDYNDKRNSAAAVLSVILGSGMSSRLFMEVREKRGLAYYVRSSSSHYHDTGVFQISAGVQVAKIDEAIKVIMSELKRIADELVDAKELVKAKEYIKGRTTLGLEDNHSKLDWVLDHQAFHKKIETPDEVLKKVEAVTAAQVQKAAKDLFSMTGLSLAVIGPYKEKKRFEKLVNN